MKIISKYIAREFLQPFLIALSSFIFVFIIVDLFDTLDETLRYNVSPLTIILYYLYLIPTIIVNVAPLSTLLATFYVIKTFNRHNEFVAIRIGGISLTGFLKPFYILGIAISVAIFFINEMLVPQTIYKADKLKSYEMRSNKNEKKKQHVLHNISFIDTDNKIYYIKNFNTNTSTIENLLITEFNDQKELDNKKAVALAHWNEEQKKWKAEKIIINNYNEDSEFRKQSIEKLDLCLTATPKELARFRNQTMYMNSFQLKTMISKFSAEDKIIRNRLLVDLHYRLSFPFISLMIMLFSIPLALFRNRNGALVTIGSGILIGLFFYFVLAVSTALGKGGYISPFLSAWMPSVIFGAGGISAIYTFHK